MKTSAINWSQSTLNSRHNDTIDKSAADLRRCNDGNSVTGWYSVIDSQSDIHLRSASYKPIRKNCSRIQRQGRSKASNTIIVRNIDVKSICYQIICGKCDTCEGLCCRRVFERVESEGKWRISGSCVEAKHWNDDAAETRSVIAAESVWGVLNH